MDTSLSVDVSDGSLLKGLCGYKRLRLTEGKRSCHKLFDFYASCSTIGDRYHLSLDRMLVEARTLFPNRGFADVNLVISHRRRVAINQRVQGIKYFADGPDYVLKIAAIKQHGVNLPQDMILWPGVRLTAVLDGLSKEGIYNSQLLRVKDWDSTHVKLVCVEGGQAYNVTHAFCARNLRLAYAMTYASIQGRSCQGSVALWDTHHPKFSRRHLVMGMSRATSADLVWLGD